MNEGCKSHLRGFACPRRTHKRTCSSRPPHADKSGCQRVGYWFYCRRRIRSIPIQERLIRACQCRCFQDDMRIKIFRSTWGRDVCWFNLAIHAQSPRHPSVKWRCSDYQAMRARFHWYLPYSLRTGLTATLTDAPCINCPGAMRGAVQGSALNHS